VVEVVDQLEKLAVHLVKKKQLPKTLISES
jgi:hypothetical protein